MNVSLLQGLAFLAFVLYVAVLGSVAGEVAARAITRAATRRRRAHRTRTVGGTRG